MGPLPNLVYYTSVTIRAVVVAEFTNDAANPAFPSVAAKCVETLPPFHRRFSHTTKRCIFGCIISPSAVFCCIADEALGKRAVFRFLEAIQSEFHHVLEARSLPVLGLLPHALDGAMAAPFARLAAPLVGLPQKERDRIEEERENAAMDDDDSEEIALRPSGSGGGGSSTKQSSHTRTHRTPLIGKHDHHHHHHSKKKKKKGSSATTTTSRDIARIDPNGAPNNLDIVVDNGGGATSSTNPANFHMHKSSSMRARGQQMARRTWRRNVCLVLLVDALICLILFGIWLAVCHGFDCIKNS